MSKKLQQFKEVLREVFQLDQADLDFGIYRIMNLKRGDIEQFLDHDLLPQVEASFREYFKDDASKVAEELSTAIEQAKHLGMNPDASPRIAELKSKMGVLPDTAQLADTVFSFLSNFFKRYYDNGDFISQRRYKKDVYAIPYEGEEVKLYWANYDQYYIKTSEYFKNYAFKLTNGKKVSFIISEASTEQNNNQAAKGKERKFSIVEEKPIEVTEEGLSINFRYDFNEAKQKELNAGALEVIHKSFQEIAKDISTIRNLAEVFDPRPTAKNKKRTLIEKHLNDFTARNTYDYFIHKDLGGFLRRELDFYIKNEVLYIDDINELDETQFHKQVTTIKVLKHIGHKVIAFLEQLENFQKKLWLKKKFVVETNYCLTLDRVPKELYPEIISNREQIEEWQKLYDIEAIESNLTQHGYSEPLSIEFLEQNQFLIVDTKHYEEVFKMRILKETNGIDDNIGGLIIQSENFQALNILHGKYREKIKCIYIDPPYNAQSSEILYKNSYKHSSWLSLLNDRVKISLPLLIGEGVSVVALDENEQNRFLNMVHEIFIDNSITSVTVVHNPGGQQGKNFAYTHEYANFIYPNNGTYIAMENREDSSDIRNFMNTAKGNTKNYLRSAGANCFYPVYVRDNQIIGFGDVCEAQFHPTPNVFRADGVLEVYPIDADGVERKWVFARSSVESIRDELNVKYNRNRNIFEIERNKTNLNYKTVWTNNKFSAKTYGTQVLSSILGAHSNNFSFPKSIHLVKECLFAATGENRRSIVLDYFAGSGTTGHAVLNLNREDGGNRKYILIEMGEYFDTVTVPRIKKVVYSEGWKDGKPIDRNGISHCFKYLRLESYEDTLNNLAIKKTPDQQVAIQFHDSFREGYMLSYALEIETEGSPSLLNVKSFEDPFNYELNITRNNETKPTKVDLVETFNYLIGLAVETFDELNGYRMITGRLREGERVLVIWRNLKEKSNEDLNGFFGRIRVNIKDTEYDRIYVNGDNFLDNMRIGEERWKVVLIEEEFKRLMFEETK